ncbi:MAG: GNAT family N-acetyltransferase [Nanoarchaeota archaeon]|nr:GNAT family N-acetyltransferase [Nanoarchaeota archaeon]
MIKIRKATPKDVPALVELNIILQDEHDQMAAKDLVLKKTILKKKTNRETFLKKSFMKTIRSKEGILILAEDGNKAIGYIEGSIRQPKTLIKKIASIWDIFVKKEYRGMGIGSMLKDAVFKIFKEKGARYIELNLSIINTKAHSIYKKWGFFDMDIMMMKKL